MLALTLSQEFEGKLLILTVRGANAMSLRRLVFAVITVLASSGFLSACHVAGHAPPGQVMPPGQAKKIMPPLG
jgi:hypothetical protein